MSRNKLKLLLLFLVGLCYGLTGCDHHRDAELQAIKFLGLKSSLPAAWIQEQPSSSMRLAQYRIANTTSDQQAELVIFYFGQGQGGSAQANIARWQSQFLSTNGKRVEPDIEQLTVNGLATTLVELRGHYARGVGVGPVGEALADQILMAAIVATSRGSVFIQLYGPASVVSQQRDAYLQFVRSIQPVHTSNDGQLNVYYSPYIWILTLRCRGPSSSYSITD